MRKALDGGDGGELDELDVGGGGLAHDRATTFWCRILFREFRIHQLAHRSL